MPPRPKISREMIVDAAFRIAREQGVEKITARTVSQALGCSTQPVMYHFQKIEDIKKAAAQKADEFHSVYLLDIPGKNPMKEIGIRYIRFGRYERNLFRLLFQSNWFSGKDIGELIGAPELEEILEILSREAEITEDQAKQVFRALFLTVHGYASMFANNEMEYDEEEISRDLDLIFNGVLTSLQKNH